MAHCHRAKCTSWQDIARKYDKGYGHFTTRQNLQYNWPKLVDVPNLLEELAEVEMHAIQTSGNCIRNVTADQYAGAIADEIEDPRPVSELIRQWSTFHPEFSFLPRKFKIAVTGAPQDRAAIKVHDIGIDTRKNDKGEVGYGIWVGGGQGRTPMIAHLIREFCPKQDLLGYLEAILRVYNQLGRRDNLYKARIKILVHQTGPEEFARLVEEEFAQVDPHGDLEKLSGEIERIFNYFKSPAFNAQADETAFEQQLKNDAEFARWVKLNTLEHKQAGYAIVNISLKPIGGVPGDASADQMDKIAELAKQYSFDEVRVTHEQNLTLPHVARTDLPALYQALVAADLATANIGLVTDIIACPGLDYCDLANARSISIAQDLSNRFGDAAKAEEIGPLKVKISGCINACGHHHVGHIGILGVDKKGTEFYQLTLGGSADENTSLGQILGPAVPAEDVGPAIENVVETYLSGREDGEDFLSYVRRAGLTVFKERLNASH